MPIDPHADPHRPPADDAETRGFDALARGQEPVHLEAAAWASRRRDGLDARGEAAFRSWLAASPRHAAALEEMEALLARLRDFPAADLAALKAGLPPPPTDRRAAPVRRRWLPGAAAALAVAVMAAGGLGWQRWYPGPGFEQAYATGRGQQLTVRLPDVPAGSTLQLDTATRLQVRLYRDRREVTLADGQAAFMVAHDAGRPFQVQAGPLRLTVLGTRFSVRHTTSGLDAGRTVVAVEEGRVRVARPAADGGAIELTAGQMVAADGTGALTPVASVPPTAIAPWRDGRLSFDRTPLAQALAEFERYGPTGLLVRDPAVAALPVGGSYSVRGFQHFADTLPRLLPVRLVQRDGVAEIVARRPGAAP